MLATVIVWISNISTGEQNNFKKLELVLPKITTYIYSHEYTIYRAYIFTLCCYADLRKNLNEMHKQTLFRGRPELSTLSKAYTVYSFL